MSARSSSTPRGSVLFTARPARPRRTWVGYRRATGLGLSLLLVGAALAAPAAAGDELKTFDAVVTADVADAPDRFAVTVTLTNTTEGGSGLQLGSANIGVPAGLTGVDGVAVDLRSPASAEFDGTSTIEARRLGLAPGGGQAVITFQATVSDCAADNAYAFTADAKQSNNFNGSGNDLTSDGAGGLTVELACAETSTAYTDGLDEACVSGNCELEVRGGGQTFAASASGPDTASLQIGVRTPGDDEFAVPGAIAAAFTDACQDIVDNPSLTGGQEVRLANAVFQFQPSGFRGTDDVRIDMTIPRSIVNQGQNRSADAFGVCFLGESDDFGAGHPLTDAPALTLDGIQDPSVPVLFGPALLPLCADGFDAPCIERREKVRADVQITVRAPAEDPWMR